MTITVTKRRLLLGAAVLFLLLLAVGVAVRLPLTGLVVGRALKAAGATEVRFHVAQASLWRVVVEDIAFLVRLQPFAARQVVVERAHWWTPSLGKVQVRQARVELRVEELAGKALVDVARPTDGPVSLPLEAISVDGQLVIRAADLPDQALTVKIDAKPAGPGSWTANTQVTAPGLALNGAGTYHLANGDLAFKVPEISLDLKTWEGFLRQLVPSLKGAELDGKFSGSVEGQLAGGRFVADGQIAIQAADGPVHALAVKVDAKKTAGDNWAGQTQVSAPGLAIKGEGMYDLASGDLGFKVSELSLDLKIWLDLLRRAVPKPTDEWEVEGKLSGSGEGRRTAGKFTAGGRIQLREGRGVSTAQTITAEGIEADVEFIDFGEVVTRPGTLNVRELRTGQLTMRDLRWEFALAGPDRIDVSHVSLQTLGGHLSAEPFRFAPSRAELDAVLLVEDVSVEEVLALTKDLPAEATGRVNGRVPVQIGGDGLRFGSGWLELRPGVHAEIQFKAKGLLSSGVAAGSPSYTALQQIESGLRKMKLNAMRLDIHPPNAPEGRSAQLHLKGEPLDKSAEVPVILDLDLNVNGPLERWLNLGMKSNLSFGAGK